MDRKTLQDTFEDLNGDLMKGMADLTGADANADPALEANQSERPVLVGLCLPRAGVAGSEAPRSMQSGARTETQTPSFRGNLECRRAMRVEES